jgi:hypothetical protein
MAHLDEPPATLTDPGELLDAYLDYYRDTVLRKIDGLSDAELRGSRLLSGWTPLAMIVHLTWVERRWFGWGFAAEPTEQPWGDRGADGAWSVPAGDSAEDVRVAFVAQCARSRAIVAGVPLDQRAAIGGRFPTAVEAPALAWIKLHVLQEYARHAGHLDIVRELADGSVGE